ncbi:MAG: pyrroline-5-carboxylate reductase [Actinomycetota bacterium]|jgi:pyrroline-5-carboxylate reductase|nr:pyrroline-5-carboxylate reductase [Actinomycetota bacterium]
MATRLEIVGGGRMGEALVVGLLNGGWARPDEMVVVEPVAARRRQLGDRFPGIGLSGTAVAADGAVLAVKPTDAEAACRDIAAAGAARVLSIVAGVPIVRLQEWLRSEVPVVRAMPNTPALVGAGAAAIAAGSTAGDADLDWAEGILGAVGVVQRVPESALDAVTGLSGSGPAYVFLVAEALIEAGVLNGLPRSTATALVIQTLLGSARLLGESGDTPEGLRAAVTSPGGTTAAGLRILENRAVRSAFLEAVTAATERSRELGQGG